MSAYVLGAALDDNVGSKPQRLLEIGSRKSVVHGSNRSRLFRDSADLANIAHGQCGVGGRLQKDHPGVLSHICLDLAMVGGVHEADFDSKFSQKRGDEPIGPAVDDIC